MALVRCVTEMGMGVDVHGLDYTNAAKRAVFDAIHHSSLGFPRLVGKTSDDMRVEVTIGVPKPEAVDRQAVLETLPHGGGHINVVHGGLQVLNEKGDDGWLIANAIIVVSMDDGSSSTVSQPDPFGFGIRGDGRRSIDGENTSSGGDQLAGRWIEQLRG